MLLPAAGAVPLQDVALAMLKCLEVFVITAGKTIAARRVARPAPVNHWLNVHGGCATAVSTPGTYRAEVDKDRAKHDRKSCNHRRVVWHTSLAPPVHWYIKVKFVRVYHAIHRTCDYLESPMPQSQLRRSDKGSRGTTCRGKRSGA